jgi:plastocyanin
MLRWLLAGGIGLACSVSMQTREAARPLAAGTIVGHIAFRPVAPQRVVSRYPGAASAPHVVESVPGVAYIDGVVPSHKPAPARERPRMEQRDTTFRPEILFVPAGTTVDFQNQDGFFHNVFSYSRAKRFDLGRFPRGESKTVTFDNAGLINVYCEIHKWMRAVIIVVENPFHATIGDDGSFTIPDVPPGMYKLVIWQVDRGRKELSVTVPPGGSTRVDAAL